MCVFGLRGGWYDIVLSRCLKTRAAATLVELTIIIIIFHSQDLLSRDVLLMFPSLRRYHHNLRICNMGIPWDVP